MNNLNSVLIEGNLVRDPELVTFDNVVMAKFSIGVNRFYRNAEKQPMKETTFVGIQTWGNLAEGCCKYLKKGRGVRVVGRLKQETWKENETNRERHVIVAEHVEFKPEVKEQQDTDEEVCEAAPKKTRGRPRKNQAPTFMPNFTEDLEREGTISPDAQGCPF